MHPLVTFWLLAAYQLTMIPLGNGSYRKPYADPGIDGPEVECPWPLDPLRLLGAPIGQYHCPYCGSMVLAGTPHPDYNFGRDGAIEPVTH